MRARHLPLTGLRSPSSGRSSTPSSAAKAAAVGDFNNDGKLDIARRQRLLRRARLEDGHRAGEAAGVRSAQLQRLVLQLCRRRQRRRPDRSDRGRFSRQGNLVVRAARKRRARRGSGTSARRSRTTKAPAIWTSTATASASCCWRYDPGKYVGYAKPSATDLWKLNAGLGRERAGHRSLLARHRRGRHQRRRPQRRARGRRLVGSAGRQGAIDLGVSPGEVRRSLLADVRLRFRRRRRQRRAVVERPPGRHLVARANARRLEDARDLRRRSRRRIA